jgi:manganese/iron transport system ATP-binding protein
MAENPRHALLAVDGLSVARGGRLVLEDVSFFAAPGDFVAVVGPNGAGKSTLFAALLGLVPRAGGRVSLAGSFAFVPQSEPEQRAFPVTAFDVALMGAYGRAGRWRPLGASEKRRAREALARVGLADRARDAFGDLSGGQRQRALLARAFVQEGSVLLLDEPLSGVDAVSEEAIVAALGQERADGRAVLIATHDLALARTRCTHALLLNRTVHALGPPAEALTAASLRSAYGDRLVVLDEAAAVDAIDEGSHHRH